jgi:hypothetical protein
VGTARVSGDVVDDGEITEPGSACSDGNRTRTAAVFGRERAGA